MNVGEEECGGKEKEDDCTKSYTKREQIEILGYDKYDVAGILTRL